MFSKLLLSLSPLSVSTVLFFPLKVLIQLWRSLIQQVRQVLPADQRLWHGLEVHAVDATSLCLPESLWPWFGAHSGLRGQGPVQSHSLFIYDVLARIPIKVRAGRVHDDERPMLQKLLPAIVKPGLILLVDSIFYSFEILATLAHLKGHWIVPLRANAKPKLLKRFSQNDGLYQILNNKHNKALKTLPDILLVRIVTVYRPGFRPRQLVTSLLDPLEFPFEEIAQLYHQRWHIETFFREFKQTLLRQHWHAQTPHAFYTELLFFMLLTCLTRLAMAQSGISPALLSFQKSLSLIKRALALSAFVSEPQWTLLYQQTLDSLATCKINIKDNRSFERDTQKRRKQSRSRKYQHLKDIRLAA